jgi:hypothetical protein
MGRRILKGRLAPALDCRFATRIRPAESTHPLNLGESAVFHSAKPLRLRVLMLKKFADLIGNPLSFRVATIIIAVQQN